MLRKNSGLPERTTCRGAGGGVEDAGLLRWHSDSDRIGALAASAIRSYPHAVSSALGLQRFCKRTPAAATDDE
jgi:hypothetical protein